MFRWSPNGVSRRGTIPPTLMFHLLGVGDLTRWHTVRFRGLHTRTNGAGVARQKGSSRPLNAGIGIHGDQKVGSSTSNIKPAVVQLHRPALEHKTTTKGEANGTHKARD